MSTVEFALFKIIQRVRSNRTQTEISKLLGYNSNQYYKFECGLKKLKLKTFLKICEINQIDINCFFEQFLDLELEITDPYYIQTQILNIFTAHQNLIHREILKTSRARWYRLLNCQADLLFEEFLIIVINLGHDHAKVINFF